MKTNKLMDEIRETMSPEMKKQMEFANKKHIPYVLFVGETEIQGNCVTVKDMTSGQQETLPISEAIRKLNSK